MLGRFRVLAPSSLKKDDSRKPLRVGAFSVLLGSSRHQIKIKLAVDVGRAEQERYYDVARM